ncbi:MAG: hypothetical protein KQA34_02450 [Candidatus Aenigmarchaeota archaeon]|nr:hypothetical protein [Candidatus Aenigmarchaeota archaeon]
MVKVIKYLNILILLFFLISFSHTFVPYKFSVTLPKNLNIKLNEEVQISLVVKNIGMIGDRYSVSIIPSTQDIYVSSNFFEFLLEPQDSKVVPINLIVYSTLGNKFINVTVCSLGLLNQVGIENKGSFICNSEECELKEGYSCITSLINLRVATFSLGEHVNEFIVFPLFLIIFVILLSFAEYRRQKL